MNLYKTVEKMLTEKRYKHTLGVVEAALALAEQYDVDKEKAELAALLHDSAKCMPIDEQEQIIRKNHLSLDALDYSSDLWHAEVGAYLAKNQLGVTDEDILQAIVYHTSGRAEMTMLEKVIFVADFIEPGRKFPGVEEARELAQVNLDRAVLYALKHTMLYLIEKNKSIYPKTVEAYNYYTKVGGNA